MIRSLFAAIGGMAAALILVIACGDDGVQSVDAQATCDCPPAEPPLSGRIAIETNSIALEASGARQSVIATCPDGALLLSGGCRLEEANAAITLNEVGRSPAGGENWRCAWQNDTVNTNTGIAEAYCLMPAE